MVDWWFGPSYLLGQVNFGIDAASVLGILLAAGGGGFYALRSLRPELSREQDIVIAAISLLSGLILIFKGWELNQIHEFNQFLLTGVAVFLAYDNIRMRAATVEQAKRRTPTVDRKRRTSRVYRAELDEIEPYKDYRDYYDDEVPSPERRRLKGTTVARPSRERAYDDRDDYDEDYGDREVERRSRRGDEQRWEERDEDDSDRRPGGGYDRRRDAWDDADDDIDYDNTRGSGRYSREGREEVRDREEDYRDRYQEERPRRDRTEARREDWQDSRRGWQDELEERPQRNARDWRDEDRSGVKEPRGDRRNDRREDNRMDVRVDARDNDDWDEPSDRERPSVEERPNMRDSARDWRGEDPNREERPPIPNVARRRSRPSEARPPEPSDSRRSTTPTPTTSTTADYADYEPLDDDYELGDSEY